MPLFDIKRLEATWEQQRAHVVCIQDPPGISLYQNIGRRSKGGKVLPVYRCARGTTSLESFHLHLNRFIPGESASSANFQAYLLEGIVRWNDDRNAAATSDVGPLVCYDRQLLASLDHLSTALDTEPGMERQTPAQYTGELIGVEYLYSNTGEDMRQEDLCEEEELPTEDDMANEPEDDDEVVEEKFDRTVPPPPATDTSSPPHLIPELEEDSSGTAGSEVEPPPLDIVQGNTEAAAVKQDSSSCAVEKKTKKN